MIRALSVTCLALLLIGGAGHEARAGKQSIGILGLEVEGSAPTAADTSVARELTNALRKRANVPSNNNYTLASGADKELFDEKLVKNCDSEAPSCMAAIGNDLNVDALMYGKIQKEGQNYVVTIKLLDVKTKPPKLEKSLINEPIAIADTIGPTASNKIQVWAKTVYAKLTGATTTGTLIVKVSNADRGTLLVNGDPRGNINDGTGQLTLDEGKAKIAVESEGFHRWEQDVTVRAGETTTVPVKLDKIEVSGTVGLDKKDDHKDDKKDDQVDKGKGSSTARTWKGVFVGALVLGVAGGGVILYGSNDINSVQKQLCEGGAYKTTPPVSCTPGTPLMPSDVTRLNDQGDRDRLLTFVGGGFAAVGGGLAILAFYEGWVAKHDDGSPEHASNGRRVHRDRFVVKPIVSPTTGGATSRYQSN
jgi:hypothetical protein